MLRIHTLKAHYITCAAHLTKGDNGDRFGGHHNHRIILPHHQSNVSRTLSQGASQVPGRPKPFGSRFQEYVLFNHSLPLSSNSLSENFHLSRSSNWGYYVTHDTLYKLMRSKSPLLPDQDKWRVHCAAWLITPNLVPKSGGS